MIRPDKKSSDVESLKNGVIKSSNNKANAPHTVLLIGEPGVGKSSLLEFIANALAGNNTDRYNLNILDRSNQQGESSDQSRPGSTRLYEITSIDATVVSAGVLSVVSMLILLPRSALLSHLVSPTLAVLSKMHSKTRVLQLRSRVISIPSMLSSP